MSKKFYKALIGCIFGVVFVYVGMYAVQNATYHSPDYIGFGQVIFGLLTCMGAIGVAVASFIE